MNHTRYKCEKMEINFYDTCKEMQVKIKLRNKKNEEIAVIEKTSSYGKPQYLLKYKNNNEWKTQNIKKQDVIDEYDKIHDAIIQKYF